MKNCVELLGGRRGIVAGCGHVASIDVESFVGFSLCEVRLIDLKKLIFYMLLREEKLRSICISSH